MRDPAKTSVLVTGASAGIGEATAILLAEEGYSVYGGARRVERMRRLENHGVHVVSLDVTDEDSCAACVETIAQREGDLDVLINNAGYGNFGSFEETPLETARAQYEVNVFGLARLTRMVLPAMRERRAGKIVNVSSVGGKMVTPLGGWYQSTKFAVEALSDALRMEMSRFGVDVIVIEPGAIKTEWGGIAGEALSEISGSGPYASLARGLSRMMEKEYARGSDPQVVARTILEAISARRPKTRYPTGARARLGLLARRILSDRALDRAMLRALS